MSPDRAGSAWAPMRVALALAAALGTCPRLPAGADEEPIIRITSPADGAMVSGPITIHVEVTPPDEAASLTEVVISVDGEVVCRLDAPPFDCDWDVGPSVEAHVIRAVATSGAGRFVATVRTRPLEYTEAVDVDAIQVIAVVTDGDGAFVKGLPRGAFRIYEDDVPQIVSHFAAERVPLELVAAIDISGSMKPAMRQVKAAARRFLTSLDAGHEVTVLAFNENLFTLARRGTDPQARGRVVDRLAAWGSTALYDAILSGLDLLGRRTGRRALVVFTDGDDKLSHATVASVVERVESSDATLYMIGQGQAVQNQALQALLTRLATLSGGRAFFEKRPSSLDTAFDDILEDLSNQYLLTYQPRNVTRDGRWRSIRVVVDRPGCHVRSRQGYRLQRRQ